MSKRLGGGPEGTAAGQASTAKKKVDEYSERPSKEEHEALVREFDQLKNKYDQDIRYWRLPASSAAAMRRLLRLPCPLPLWSRRKRRCPC